MRIYLDTNLYKFVAECGEGTQRKNSLMSFAAIGQRLFVGVWDGAPIHRAQVVKDFLAHSGAARIRLEQLPAYAPELNPEEGIWNLLKRVELRNLCCDDLTELRLELRSAAARLRHNRTVIQGCISQCGYAITPCSGLL